MPLDKVFSFLKLKLIHQVDDKIQGKRKGIDRVFETKTFETKQRWNRDKGGNKVKYKQAYHRIILMKTPEEDFRTKRRIPYSSSLTSFSCPLLPFPRGVRG